MTSTATLAACGHSTDVPAQLCAHCTTRLHATLSRMPDLHTALAAWLPPAARRPELGHAPAVEAPLPLREVVLDLRGPGGIVGVLEDWQAAVHDARGFTTPARTGSIPTRISNAAGQIQRNLTWISLTWDQGPALATEIRRLESRALAVINPPDRSIPIGACPTDLGDGAVCGATIRVTAGTTDVRCRRCGTGFPPDTWINLATWMNRDRQQGGGIIAS